MEEERAEERADELADELADEEKENSVMKSVWNNRRRSSLYVSLVVYDSRSKISTTAWNCRVCKTPLDLDIAKLTMHAVSEDDCWYEELSLSMFMGSIIGKGEPFYVGRDIHSLWQWRQERWSLCAPICTCWQSYHKTEQERDTWKRRSNEQKLCRWC